MGDSQLTVGEAFDSDIVDDTYWYRIEQKHSFGRWDAEELGPVSYTHMTLTTTPYV